MRRPDKQRTSCRDAHISKSHLRSAAADVLGNGENITVVAGDDLQQQQGNCSLVGIIQAQRVF